MPPRGRVGFLRHRPRQIVIVEVLAIRRHQCLVGYAVCILPVGCLWCEERAERFPVCLRGVLPIGPDGTPAITEALLVGVTVLRYDGGDPFRVADGEPETSRCAIIKHIHRKPVESDDLGKSIDHGGDIVERVSEFFLRRHIGLAESRKVRCGNMKPVREKRDQIAEHVARAWESVQEQELRLIGISRLAIEHFEASTSAVRYLIGAIRPSSACNSTVGACTATASFSCPLRSGSRHG
jgi:hypothetical protein